MRSANVWHIVIMIAIASALASFFVLNLWPDIDHIAQPKVQRVTRAVMQIAPMGSVAPALWTDGNPCEKATDTYGCWRTYYSALDEKSGPEVSLADLKARYGTDEVSIKSYCHPLLHIIGRDAFTRYGSLQKAFQHGDQVCRGGFFHGVMEGLAEVDGKGFLSHLDEVCAAAPGKSRYSNEYFNCVHGIGHGLMAHFDEDLIASIKGCDSLSGAWEQQSCYGGAFMQNSMNFDDASSTSMFKDDDLQYPCNAVSEKAKIQCYEMQTSHMLQATHYDYDAVFKLCSESGPAYRVTCYQSLGRDASGITQSDATSTLTICDRGTDREQKLNCLIGAGIDYLAFYHKVEPAYALCRAAEEWMTNPCLDKVRSYWRLY